MQMEVWYGIMAQWCAEEWPNRDVWIEIEKAVCAKA